MRAAIMEEEPPGLGEEMGPSLEAWAVRGPVASRRPVGRDSLSEGRTFGMASLRKGEPSEGKAFGRESLRKGEPDGD
jgi:hypothetical protein